MIFHSSVLVNREWVRFHGNFQFIEECCRFVVENHIRRNLPIADFFYDMGNPIGNPSGIREDADRAAFVVGDRELVQCSDTAGNHDDGIAGADVDDVALHESLSRKNHDVVMAGGEVFVHMLVLGEGGRNTDGHSSFLLGGDGRFIRNTRTSAIDQDIAALCDLATHGTRLLNGLRILRLDAARRTDDPDFEFHAYVVVILLYRSVHELSFPMERAFIALPLEGEARESFLRLQETLHEYGEIFAFQNPESPHLTLYFWPSLMEIEYHDVVRRMEKIVLRTPPFIMHVSGAELFKDDRTKLPRVLSLAIDRSEELSHLKKLCPWPNIHQFAPHITLARIRKPHDFLIHDKKILKLLKHISFSVPVDRVRFYAEIEGKKQTPIRDFVFATA